jgi:outer membrane receptor protein involved in Fe transport
MIRSIAFVLASSAARGPVQPGPDGTVPLDVAAVAVYRAGTHEEPFQSWVFTSDDLDRYGARSLGDALRLTPGVVTDRYSGRIFIQGAPLDDGSVMLDGVSLMGTPHAYR